MNKDTYIAIMKWIRQREKVALTIRIGNKILTAFVYVSFFAFLVGMFVTGDKGWLNVMLITGIPFVMVSLIRKQLGRKRPYEIYGVEPVIGRDKTGDSFPSRHIFSAFVIATTLGSINICIGIALGIAGLIMAGLRVIGGVHFISDVVAGMIIGMSSGFVGIMIIGI